MINDKNVRSLPAILVLAKKIIEEGREVEFVQACQGRDDLFVVSTDAAREFMAGFLKQHKIDPTGTQISNFNYSGFSQC